MNRRFVLPLLAALLAGAAHAQPAAGQAYVSNQKGSIAVVDLSTFEITGRMDPFGGEPRGIGVSGDGRWLVVALRVEGAIAVIDRASGRLVRKVKIGANPEFVRVRGETAFVTYEPGSGGKPPAAGSAAAAGKDDDDKAEAAHIAVVDLRAGKVVRSIRGGRETEGIEFSADGRHILVTNEAEDTITVHAIASGALVKTVDVKPYGQRPRGIKLAPDRRHYVATLEFGNAFVVLGADYRVEKVVKTGESPYGVSFDRDGRRLFVAAAKSQLLQVYDATTWTHLKDVPIGKRCWHFSFTPDGREILMACGRSDELLVIDAERLEVTRHVADDGMPWGVVTYPKSMGSLDQP